MTPPPRGRTVGTSIKIIVEKHPDGYVAYPLGLKSAVVGQGDTYEAALSDVRSAIAFPVDAPQAKVIRALSVLGFRVYAADLARERTARLRESA